MMFAPGPTVNPANQQQSPFRVPSFPGPSVTKSPLRSPSSSRKNNTMTPVDDENKENRPELFQPTNEKSTGALATDGGHSKQVDSVMNTPNFIAQESINRRKLKLRRSRATTAPQPLSDISVQALDRLPEHSSFVFNLIATSVTKGTVGKLAGRWFSTEDLDYITNNWDGIMELLMAAKHSILAASSADPLASLGAVLTQSNNDSSNEADAGGSAVSLYDLVVNYQQLAFERRAASVESTVRPITTKPQFEIYCDTDENSTSSVAVLSAGDPVVVEGWRSPGRLRYQSQQLQLQQQRQVKPVEPATETAKQQQSVSAEDSTALLMSPRRAKRKRAPNNNVVAELETLVENGMALFSPPRPARSSNTAVSASKSQTSGPASAAANDASAQSQSGNRRQTRSAKRLFK